MPISAAGVTIKVRMVAKPSPNTIAVDNEIHHRGQGYVYLRALGIAPPAFYDRS